MGRSPSGRAVMAEATAWAKAQREATGHWVWEDYSLWDPSLPDLNTALTSLLPQLEPEPVWSCWGGS